MPYEFYKVLHYFGLFLTLSGMIGLISIFWSGAQPQNKLRKVLIISHGLGLLLILVSGFGLAARLGYVSGLPVWIYYKLTVWLAIGAAIALIKRLNKYSTVWFIVTLGLFTAAALIAVNKPGM